MGIVRIEEVADMFTKSPPYSINVGWRWLENTIENWRKDQEVQISPDFQRMHVWTEDQQIKFVEYIMRGGHAGKEIYWNCSDWGRGYSKPLQLVDGKQRITAVRRFLADEIKAFGYKRSQFKCLNTFQCDFIFYINDLQTRQEVLQWYLDLNTCGTPHTEEDLEKVRRLMA